jgi:Kef-type K+ transport system membrane component KefB
MFAIIRPSLRKWFEVWPPQSKTDRMLLSMCVIFLSAITTDLIGLHSILGAFVAGAVLPRAALDGWRDSVMHVCQTLLLPFFFILTGMHLNINVYDPLFWQLTFLFTLCAVLGKFVSVAIMARLTGLRWGDSFALGSLMQCKGLMELVAINILLETGIISASAFSSLAMMALISTFITAPLMHMVLRSRRTNPVFISVAAAQVDLEGYRSGDRKSDLPARSATK